LDEAVVTANYSESRVCLNEFSHGEEDCMQNKNDLEEKKKKKKKKKK
jgi:hypothetical protein